MKPWAISDELRVLSHPWYRKWECGELSRDSLRHYASEYYWQVANFPRYLSHLHSQIKSLEDRRVILENLNDEENKNAPHPELWLDFAEAMGADREAIRQGAPGEAARELVAEFRALMAAGAPEGLGALLAYESQVPEVAKFKRDALEKFYLNDATREAGTRFFAVHEKADVWHTEELLKVVAKLSPAEQVRARAASEKAARALLKFLDTMPDDGQPCTLH